LMSALQDEEGELYVQSPAYLYEMLWTHKVFPFRLIVTFTPCDVMDAHAELWSEWSFSIYKKGVK
jgi:hypothetical protein